MMKQDGQTDGRTLVNRQDRQDSFEAPDKDGLGGHRQTDADQDGDKWNARRT